MQRIGTLDWGTEVPISSTIRRPLTRIGYQGTRGYRFRRKRYNDKKWPKATSTVPKLRRWVLSGITGSCYRQWASSDQSIPVLVLLLMKQKYTVLYFESHREKPMAMELAQKTCVQPQTRSNTVVATGSVQPSVVRTSDLQWRRGMPNWTWGGGAIPGTMSLRHSPDNLNLTESDDVEVFEWYHWYFS